MSAITQALSSIGISLDSSTSSDSTSGTASASGTSYTSGSGASSATSDAGTQQALQSFMQSLLAALHAQGAAASGQADSSDGGNAAGTIALEKQWNALTQDRPYFTLCGYATSCFQNGSADLWSSVCAEHWAVSQASDAF